MKTHSNKYATHVTVNENKLAVIIAIDKARCVISNQVNFNRPLRGVPDCIPLLEESDVCLIFQGTSGVSINGKDTDTHCVIMTLVLNLSQVWRSN